MSTNLFRAFRVVVACFVCLSGAVFAGTTQEFDSLTELVNLAPKNAVGVQVFGAGEIQNAATGMGDFMNPSSILDYAIDKPGTTVRIDPTNKQSSPPEYTLLANNFTLSAGTLYASGSTAELEIVRGLLIDDTGIFKQTGGVLYAVGGVESGSAGLEMFGTKSHAIDGTVIYSSTGSANAIQAMGGAIAFGANAVIQPVVNFDAPNALNVTPMSGNIYAGGMSFDSGSQLVPVYANTHLFDPAHTDARSALASLTFTGVPDTSNIETLTIGANFDYAAGDIEMKISGLNLKSTASDLVSDAGEKAALGYILDGAKTTGGDFIRLNDTAYNMRSLPDLENFASGLVTRMDPHEQLAPMALQHSQRYDLPWDRLHQIIGDQYNYIDFQIQHPDDPPLFGQLVGDQSGDGQSGGAPSVSDSVRRRILDPNTPMAERLALLGAMTDAERRAFFNSLTLEELLALLASLSAEDAAALFKAFAAQLGASLSQLTREELEEFLDGMDLGKLVAIIKSMTPKEAAGLIVAFRKVLGDLPGSLDSGSLGEFGKFGDFFNALRKEINPFVLPNILAQLPGEILNQILGLIKDEEDRAKLRASVLRLRGAGSATKPDFIDDADLTVSVGRTLEPLPNPDEALINQHSQENDRRTMDSIIKGAALSATPNSYDSPSLVFTPQAGENLPVPPERPERPDSIDDAALTVSVGRTLEPPPNLNENQSSGDGASPTEPASAGNGLPEQPDFIDEADLTVSVKEDKDGPLTGDALFQVGVKLLLQKDAAGIMDNLRNQSLEYLYQFFFRIQYLDALKLWEILSPAQLAEILSRLDPLAVARFLFLLGSEKAAEIIAQMPESERQGYLDAATPARQLAILQKEGPLPNDSKAVPQISIAMLLGRSAEDILKELQGYSRQELADLLNSMQAAQANRLANMLPHDVLVELLSSLHPDNVAAFLAMLDPELREKVLAALPESVRQAYKDAVTADLMLETQTRQGGGVKGAFGTWGSKLSGEILLGLSQEKLSDAIRQAANTSELDWVIYRMSEEDFNALLSTITDPELRAVLLKARELGSTSGGGLYTTITTTKFKSGVMEFSDPADMEKALDFLEEKEFYNYEIIDGLLYINDNQAMYEKLKSELSDHIEDSWENDTPSTKTVLNNKEIEKDSSIVFDSIFKSVYEFILDSRKIGKTISFEDAIRRLKGPLEYILRQDDPDGYDVDLSLFVRNLDQKSREQFALLIPIEDLVWGGDHCVNITAATWLKSSDSGLFELVSAYTPKEQLFFLIKTTEGFASSIQRATPDSDSMQNLFSLFARQPSNILEQIPPETWAIVGPTFGEERCQQLRDKGANINTGALPTSGSPDHSAARTRARPARFALESEAAYLARLPEPLRAELTAETAPSRRGGGAPAGVFSASALASAADFARSGARQPGSITLWASPFYQQSSRTPSGGKDKVHGLTLGLTRNFGNLALGGQFSWSNSRSRSRASDSDSDTYGFTATARFMNLFRRGESAFNPWLSFSLGYSYQKFDNDRVGVDAVYNARPHSDLYRAGMAFGNTWQVAPRFFLTPQLNLDYSHVRQSESREKGPGLMAMRTRGTKTDSLRPGAGLDLMFQATERTSITARASYRYETLDRSSNTYSSFLGNPLFFFDSEGKKRDPSSGSLGLGASHKFNECVSVNADYSLSLAEHSRSHQFSAVVNINF